MASSFHRASRNRFLKFGAPFVVMLVGGSFGLKYFAQIRYDVSKKKMVSPEEAQEMGIDMKSEKSSPQEELKKLETNLDLEQWENIRGPRPWEDSKTVQELERQARQKAS